MQTQIITIGNSRGIIIPKAILQKTRLSGAVEVDIKGDEIVIRKLKDDVPRAGWAAQIEAAGVPGLTDEDSDWLSAPLVGDNQDDV